MVNDIITSCPKSAIAKISKHSIQRAITIMIELSSKKHVSVLVEKWKYRNTKHQVDAALNNEISAETVGLLMEVRMYS